MKNHVSSAKAQGAQKMINVLREIDSLIEFLEAKKEKVSPAIVKKLMGKLGLKFITI